jgi:excisionase family DNA binding protein
MTQTANSFSRDTADKPDFHTVKETARHLRLCEKQVRRLIWCGDLPAYRFGTALRIKKVDIDAYADANRINVDFRKKYRGTSS